MRKEKFTGREEEGNPVNGNGSYVAAESLVNGIADCFIEEALQYGENLQENTVSEGLFGDDKAGEGLLEDNKANEGLLRENKKSGELFEDNNRISMKEMQTKKWYKTLGFRLAASVAFCFIIGISSIMGVTAAGNLRAYEYLYRIHPGLAESMLPVQKSCMDQGIEMKVEAIKIEGKQANIYVSLRDTTGDRIDQTTDLFDSYHVNTNCDQASGCSLISYDEETKTASFLIQIDQHTEKFTGKRMTFSVSELLLQKQETTMELPQIRLNELKEKTGDELYEASELTFRGWGGSGLADFGDEKKNIWHYLKADEKQTFQAVPGARITAYGLVDGMLHIQIYYEDIIHKDNHGDIRLKDANGKEYICLGNISFWDEEHQGSYEEYLFEPMDDREFEEFTVLGWFVTAGELLEGDWKISFPIENLEE